MSTKIKTQKDTIQQPDAGLNLVGPTLTPLDDDFLAINRNFAAKFTALNGGADNVR